MRAPHPPIVRDETCPCGARLRLEDPIHVHDWHFTVWRREHICTVREAKP